jgi:hypothetical protein
MNERKSETHLNDYHLVQITWIQFTEDRTQKLIDGDDEANRIKISQVGIESLSHA